MTQMKGDQDILERNLWAEREVIYAKYHDKFKTAQTKSGCYFHSEVVFFSDEEFYLEHK